MSTVADFLVELGTEELPPKALSTLATAFLEGVTAGLGSARLSFAESESFATPRRLAVLVRRLDLQQAQRDIEKRGPPVKVAFDAQGRPTRAARAFAKDCGVAVEELHRVATDKGDWLFFRGQHIGQSAEQLLPGIVREALADLPIPKRMRWGNHDAEFVRPVHWLVMMLDERVLPATILGCAAGNQTRGHRVHAPEPITLSRPAEYAALLSQQGHVIAPYGARRNKIRDLANQAARELGGRAVLDPKVLDEVTALVEWPVPVVGRFDARFLHLPAEVLVATMQDHQRYFPVRGADGELMANFIAISNLDSREPEQVQQGNERVVMPRLSDAEFFWKQDTKTALAERCGALKQVIFQRELGSLYEKSIRVAALAAEFAQTLGGRPAHAQRAAELAKTDLLTAMVGEFPELQGRMGYYYARNDGEPDEVCVALEEQYLPRHAGDRLPGTPTGMALALADRLDTLAGIFALGTRPSGNKDPFGLRRAALGLRAQPLDLKNPDELVDQVFEFVTDRLRAYCLDGLAPDLARGAVSTEMFEAVRARRPTSPLDFHARLRALQGFMNLDAAESLTLANKRIANILRSAAPEDIAAVDPALFEADEERGLHAAVEGLRTNHAERLGRRDYVSVLQALAGLREPVDTFFDAVLVMADDEAQRRNST
jgi:glycyl-tRNA synthetase beta chain